MKKIIFSIFACFFVCGCWNYKELNEYSIVTGIAIDKIDNEYNVSVLISNVSKKNSGTDSNPSSDIVIYEGKGKSISEALKDIGLISPKELYLNSFSILIISEDAAKDGIENTIDFFLKYSSSRNNFNVVIARDCKAKDTLKILTSITNYPSQSISDNLKTTAKLQGAIKRISFDDLVSTLIKKGIDPTLSTIRIIGDVTIGSSKENLETSEPKTYIKLDTLAIFKNDKLIDFATHDESVGINILSNRVNELYFNLDVDEGFVVIDTTSFKSKMKLQIKDNIPIIKINLTGEARIIESNGNINLSDDTVIESIQKESNKVIESFVVKAINLSKKDNTDILGIGRIIYENYPKYYNEHQDDILDLYDFEIESNIIINNKVSAKTSLEEANDRSKN